jgi:hypothetical protein
MPVMMPRSWLVIDPNPPPPPRGLGGASRGAQKHLFEMALRVQKYVEILLVWRSMIAESTVISLVRNAIDNSLLFVVLFLANLDSFKSSRSWGNIERNQYRGPRLMDYESRVQCI